MSEDIVYVIFLNTYVILGRDHEESLERSLKEWGKILKNKVGI